MIHNETCPDTRALQSMRRRNQSSIALRDALFVDRHKLNCRDRILNKSKCLSDAEIKIAQSFNPSFAPSARPAKVDARDAPLISNAQSQGMKLRTCKQPEVI